MERWEKEVGWTAYHIGRKALYMMRASSSSSEGSASRKTRLLSIADISLAGRAMPLFSPVMETDDVK